MPAFYKGLPDTVIGPEEAIPWPAYTDRLDHELDSPGGESPARSCDVGESAEHAGVDLRLHDLEQHVGA